MVQSLLEQLSRERGQNIAFLLSLSQRSFTCSFWTCKGSRSSVFQLPITKTCARCRDPPHICFSVLACREDTFPHVLLQEVMAPLVAFSLVRLRIHLDRFKGDAILLPSCCNPPRARKNLLQHQCVWILLVCHLRYFSDHLHRLMTLGAHCGNES